MSATNAGDRAFEQYADLYDQALKWLAERDEAIAERDRLREREAHFAKVLGVGDGGQYRNDWDSRIEALIAERDLAAQDADRRSCQGGWRLAQERACELIRLQREVERLRPIVAHIAGLRVSDSRGYSRVHRSLAAIAREALGDPEPR